MPSPTKASSSSFFTVRTLHIACESLDHYRDLTNAWTDDLTLGIERISSKPELQTIKAFRGVPLR